MRVRENYLKDIEKYYVFRGDKDDTLDLMEKFYLYLKTNYSKGNTRNVIWNAAVNYYKSNVIGKTIPMENWVKEIAWIKYKYGNINDSDFTPIYHVSDNEYREILSNSSDRVRIVIKAIRETNMKISLLLSLRPHAKEIQHKLKKEIEIVYGGKNWLFETRVNGYLTGNNLSASYISNRIKKAGRDILGKEISAESIRRVA